MPARGGLAAPPPVPSSLATRDLLILLALLAVGWLARVGVTAAVQGLDSAPDPGAYPDQIEYQVYARQMLAGRGYADAEGEPTAARAPGTSFTLLVPYALFGPRPLPAHLFFCFLSALTGTVAAAFAWRAFGRAAGLWTAALLALHPGSVYYAMHFVSEVPFALFTALAALATFEALCAPRSRAALAWDVAAGLAGGLAALVRPQLLLLTPVGLGACFLRRRGERLRSALHVAAQCALAVALLVPWVARNAQVLGSPTVTTIGAYTFWGAHNELVLRDPQKIGGWVPVDALLPPDWPRGELERARVAWREGLAFVREHRAEMPRLLAWKAARWLSPFSDTPNRTVNAGFAAAWLVTAPLAVWGALGAWRRSRLGLGVCAAHLLAALGTALLFYGSVRFRHASLPIYGALAGAGIARLWAWARAPR